VGVPAHVLDVLRRSAVDADGLTLPGQLDRADYMAVNKFLETSGAKYNRKLGKHVFNGPAARDKITGLLDSGTVVDDKKTYNAFYTPADVAERLADLADLKGGMFCLEPSAGEGAIATVLRDRVCVVTCVEINPQTARSLERQGFETIPQDFLTVAPTPKLQFDRVVMNPPFAGNQDIAHVTHALKFLKPGGKLVAVMGKGFTFGEAKPRREFRQLMADLGGRILCDLPAGTFKESGTDVATVVVGITKP
jgi:predicted RNA methylase